MAAYSRSKPVFMDGLTTHKSYLVLATDPNNPVFNCLCLRKMGGDEYKLKFYPNASEWGFSVHELLDKGLRSHLHREQHLHHYDRFYTAKRPVFQILNEIRSKGVGLVVPEQLLQSAFEDWYTHQENCVFEGEAVAA